MILKNQSIKDYHAEKEHLSASTLKHGLRSMKEMKYYLDGKIPTLSGSHLDFGNAFENYLMSKESFEKTVAVFDPQPAIDLLLSKNPLLKAPTMTNEFKAFKVEFENLNKEKYIISKSGDESKEMIIEMYNSCQSDPVISKLISGMEQQVSIYWECPNTGLKLKTRPDISRTERNVIVDIKTTKDASPRAFCRQINDLSYWLQACMQIDGSLESGYMSTVDAYFWLAVEKQAPFNAVLYEFTKEDIERKIFDYKNLLSKVATCFDSGIWPGYSDQSTNNFGILKAQIY